MAERAIAHVAFLGTGLMGAPMAANLLAAGYRVTVWNRTPAKAQPLVDQGATLAQTPAAAVADVDAAVAMLADGPAVEDLLEAQGVADALPHGALFVDCASIPPATARRHAERLAGRGVGYLDAPVSGGPSGAESASLAIMVGGSETDVARGEPLLRAMGTPTRVGPAGAGQTAKLANQVIVGLAIGAVAEALLLAERGGADPAKVKQALTGGFADSKVLQIHGQRMLDRTFVPGAAARVHLKDMETILDTAREGGLSLPLSQTVHDLFRDLADRGGAGYDHSALLLELERRNAPARLGDKPDRLPANDG
ncbi:2-hydroxy-3-oxopropionate reductase [Rhodovibrio sodomensis]|uniref:2-hydroxy-3-oxopropionate reductase n=1 Tax=Rhodovibrio sodomensis TaxID=1088 RepID=A0ABS1DI15_9PROT|nr:NAD(P)-dependent oxidoreductase [Rhodovibrio sodomensis]MBK1669484.1 2-hydroxy-3-oxopropionate reductase [Rhodovibrio sodomensis]